MTTRGMPCSNKTQHPKQVGSAEAATRSPLGAADLSLLGVASSPPGRAAPSWRSFFLNNEPFLGYAASKLVNINMGGLWFGRRAGKS